jgi:hypothetical protein
MGDTVIGHQTCTFCKGSGKRNGWKCDVCNGTGKMPIYENRPEQPKDKEMTIPQSDNAGPKAE